MGRKSTKKSIRERRKIFEEVTNGETFGVVAYRHKMGTNSLSALLNEYEPYIEWVNERRNDPELLEREARGLIEAGKTVKFIEEHFRLSPIEADRLVKKIQKVHGGTAFRVPGERDIFVDDVERFRDSVSIGDVLVCGVSPEGLLRLCRIRKKYKHFADTDDGTYQWNWLTVRNKEKIPK